MGFGQNNTNVVCDLGFQVKGHRFENDHGRPSGWGGLYNLPGCTTYRVGTRKGTMYRVTMYRVQRCTGLYPATCSMVPGTMYRVERCTGLKTEHCTMYRVSSVQSTGIQRCDVPGCSMYRVHNGKLYDVPGSIRAMYRVRSVQCTGLSDVPG